MSGWNAPDKPSHLKKCSEFHDQNCGQPITDGCCPVIPCSYCLRWEVYGEDDQFGVADVGVTGWTGTIAGATFLGFWERNTYGDCEFIVTIDGEEVYRKSCYEGQSCRDSSDSVETTINYEDGTLYWDKRLHRPLEYVVDYETQCRTKFCGSCECTCETLCAVITDEYTGEEIARGELSDTAYDCDGPVWEGLITGTRDGYPVEFDLSLALADCDGGCCIVTSEGGYEVGTMSVTGCTDLTGTMLLDADTRLTVTCKICECAAATGGCCDIPCADWPQTLTATVEFYNADCGDCTDVVTLDKQGCDGETIYTAPEASCTGDAPDLGGNSINFLDLRCTNNADVCGTPGNPLTDDPFTFSDDISRSTNTPYVLDLETACCSPLFLQFTCNHPSFCVPFAMGGASGTVRVTITG